MSKLWPIIFHVCVGLCPVLVAIATHNYAAAASGAYGLVTSILATYGIGGAGVASLFGAIIAHHKTTAAAAAALPTTQAVAPSQRGKVLDLLWADMGKDATDAEIAAFKGIRDASKGKST